MTGKRSDTDRDQSDDRSPQCHWWDNLHGEQCLLTEGHTGEHSWKEVKDDD